MMLAATNYFEERECTERCKSKEHAAIVCAALTKRDVSDSDLCAFINSVCCRCENVKDNLGRTALHIAASCGRLNVVKWLLHAKQANINVKDEESGYTSLHRSIYYGKIEVATYLLKQGAAASSVDLNGLTGLDHAMKDSKTTLLLHKTDKAQVYVWGSNANYVFGPQQARLIPDILDSFHKENPHCYVKQVCLEKFHCVLVATNGKVYTCGHGYGGRLGLGTEETWMTPKLVKFVPRLKSDIWPVLCVKASISIDHSVFLSSSGHVWTCGLNTHCVLGIKPPPPQILEPYQLKYFQTHIRGIGTGRYHTVAWGSESIFTWGLNAGQMGHNKVDGKYIIVPKMVLCPFKPQTIAVNNCATAVLNTHGNICVFHDYQMLKISAKLLSLTNISISGGRISSKLDNSAVEETNELKIVGINKGGALYIWQETSPNFLQCIFSINRSLNITQITLNLNEILFVTQEGEAFHATIKNAKRKLLDDNKPRSTNLMDNDNQLVKITKIPNVHRAIFIASDYQGKNFAVLQIAPSALLELPRMSPSVMADDLLKLAYTPENELFQDVTFKINGQLFHLHSYIIATGSRELYKFVQNHSSGFIELSNVDLVSFEQIILHLYTQGSATYKINKLLEKANILKETDESKFIQKDKTESYSQVHKFNYAAFPELHDVVLRSKDDKLLPVHGCMLLARSDYFNNCFSMRWNENSLKNQEILVPFPHSTLIQLIEYLYTDELPGLSSADLDQVCNLLVAADQMCIFRLKELCQCTLCTFVTLKNVGQVLHFASNYYAQKLKDYCMEFVSLNLPAILEAKSLEYLNHELLLELTDFYCNYYHPVMQYRVITSYSTAPSDEIVMLAGKSHKIAFEDTDDESSNLKSTPKTQKRRTRQRKGSSSENTPTGKNLSQTIESSPPVTATFQTKRDDVPSRIKAIVSALETINSETNVTSFEEFPSLNNSIYTTKNKPPKSADKCEVRQKITKVSQKERKRLSSLSSIAESGSVSETAESPKNPWKVVPLASSPDNTVAVQSIIIEEKRQKENFVKMKFKHLTHIQIEDKAIEDLHKFYNVDVVFDEIITIRRVEMGAIATPQWSRTNKKN